MAPEKGRPTELPVGGWMGEVVPPIELEPAIPPELSTLCEQLLRAVPGERPTGADVIRRLGGDGVTSELGERPPRAFVGRGDEQRALRDAFFAASRGHAVTVHLTGESGIGK